MSDFAFLLNCNGLHVFVILPRRADFFGIRLQDSTDILVGGDYKKEM